MPRISARVPLRLGLAGGGTDLSAYADVHGGAVLNATINRYAYVFLEPTGSEKVEFCAADLGIHEELKLTHEGLATSKLVLHSGVIKSLTQRVGDVRDVFECLRGTRVTTFVDAPAGSGLGSSSALVVGLLKAFTEKLGILLNPSNLALIAYQIERKDLGLSGGRQDHYSAAYGGINFLEFYGKERTIVSPLSVPGHFLNEFESSLVICFTGISRSSENIINQQNSELNSGAGKTALEAMHQMKQDAVAMVGHVMAGRMAGIASTMNHSWQAKKRTATAVSTECIDRLYAIAMEQGALSGKVSGAGGGGFMMFIVPPMRRYSIITALNAAGGTASGVQLVSRGAQVWSS